MMINKKVIKIQVSPTLCFGYFRAAQLSLQYVLNQRNIGKFKTSRNIRDKFPTYNPPFDKENGNLIMTARFNFKHALELSMKALFMKVQEPPAGHDLEEICKEMRNKLLNVSILEESLEVWEWLVDNYYTNDKFAPKDVNELDRYMFSRTGNKFPYKDIHSLTRKDLQVFLRDIKTAKQLFWRMDAEYDFINACKKFGYDPNKKQKNTTKTIVCRTKNGRYYTRRKAGVHKYDMLDN